MEEEEEEVEEKMEEGVRGGVNVKIGCEVEDVWDSEEEEEDEEEPPLGWTSKLNTSGGPLIDEDESSSMIDRWCHEEEEEEEEEELGDVMCEEEEVKVDEDLLRTINDLMDECKSEDATNYKEEEEEEEEEKDALDDGRGDRFDEEGDRFDGEVQVDIADLLDADETEADDGKPITLLEQEWNKSHEGKEFEDVIWENPAVSYGERKIQQNYRILNKIADSGRPFNSVEKYGWDMVDDLDIPPPTPDTLYSLIPTALEDTLTLIRERVQDAQCITIVHDSTPKWHKDFLGVMMHWVDQDGSYHCVPIGFEVVTEDGSQALNSANLNARLGDVMTKLGISPDFVYGLISDRHSVNKKLNKDYLPKLFANATSLLCCCHTLDTSLKTLSSDIVWLFYEGWRPITGSTKFVEQFKLYVGNDKGEPITPIVDRSIRWGAALVALRQILDHNMAIREMLDGDLSNPGWFSKNVAVASTAKLENLIRPKEQWNEFLVQLSILVEVGERIKRAMDQLERDGYEIFRAYDVVNTLMNELDGPEDLLLPKTKEFVKERELETTDSWKDEEFRKSIYSPALKYLKDQFRSESFQTGLKGQLCLMRDLRILNPEFVATIGIDELRGTLKTLKGKCKFIGKNFKGLKEMVSVYHQLCTKVVNEGKKGKKKVWKERVKANFARMVKLVEDLKGKGVDASVWTLVMRATMTLQPSSASCERLFSQFTNVFTKGRGHALQDLYKFCMLRFFLNKMWHDEGKST